MRAIFPIAGREGREMLAADGETHAGDWAAGTSMSKMVRGSADWGKGRGKGPIKLETKTGLEVGGAVRQWRRVIASELARSF